MYYTITYIREDMAKRIREWEREFKYERNIVRSVPARKIGCEQEITQTTDRWKPG